MLVAETLSPEQSRLAERYMPLALKLAGKVRGLKRLDVGERASAALYGLCRAALKYDPDQDANFATYARSAIVRWMVRANHEAAVVHVPMNLQESRGAGVEDGRRDAADRALGCRHLPGHFVFPGGGPSPLDDAEERDEQARFRAAIDRLSRPQREAILDRLAGMTLQQSADLRGVSREATRIRVDRAVRNLKMALAAGGES